MVLLPSHRVAVNACTAALPFATSQDATPSSRVCCAGTRRLVQVLIDRHKGSMIEAWKNNPIYMTGPGVLTHTVQHYLKIQGPVPGFIGTTYLVSCSTIARA